MSSKMVWIALVWIGDIEVSPFHDRQKITVCKQDEERASLLQDDRAIPVEEEEALPVAASA